jgi:hypothetical protein
MRVQDKYGARVKGQRSHADELTGQKLSKKDRETKKWTSGKLKSR